MRFAPQTRPRFGRWVGLLALLVLLAGCGHSRRVRHDDDYYRPRHRATVTPARQAGAGEVEVARGDTLYGIAFRNGMDFRELAAINGIGPPYTIYVGQVLRLRGRSSRSLGNEPGGRAPTRPATATAPPIHRAPPVSTAPPVRAAPASPAIQPPRVANTDTESEQPPAPMRVEPTLPPPLPDIAPPRPSAATLPADVATVGGVHWRWPAAGNLIGRFVPGDATQQGIDIAGHAGDPVVAASDGVVVYSGSGLVGYGELIIVKHSDEWLSAYGHNRKRLVIEGQRVRAGQPIAEMGNTGASRDELHFEIRRNGRPVDPLQYLPAR